LEKIIIKSLKIFAYHGCNEDEKQNGQDFFIDAVLVVNGNWTSQSDELSETVNYSSVVKLIKNETVNNRYNLIETLAARLCEAVMDEFSQVTGLTVTVKKPHAPVNADFDYMAVEKHVKRS